MTQKMERRRSSEEAFIVVLALSCDVTDLLMIVKLVIRLKLVK